MHSSRSAKPGRALAGEGGERFLAPGDLLAEGAGGKAPEGGGGMGLGVIGHLVAGRAHGIDQFGVAAGALADEEEGSAGVVSPQEFEGGEGGGRVGAVIESEPDHGLGGPEARAHRTEEPRAGDEGSGEEEAVPEEERDEGEAGVAEDEQSESGQVGEDEEAHGDYSLGRF